MPVGARIFLRRNLPCEELVAGYRNIATANIADAMGRSCALNPRIKLISRPTAPVMAGPALTVKARAGDNLLLHQALDIAAKGDIIVVANEADGSRALLGEIMATYAYCSREIGGLVLDGPVRDIDVLSKMDFPIYATGATPAGPYKEGPGEINVPVACGEISVNPGDLIVADADGVIVIPTRDAAGILEEARRIQKKDAEKARAAASGTAKRDWVAKAIAEKGIEIIDDVYRA